MNTSTASGYRARSCAAPCVSMSSSTSWPAPSDSSSARARVPYRWPCTVAHSANSPRASIARNSASVTKRKSAPSISPARGARVVTDTEYARSGSRSRISRHKVVLPAPDGAETTNRVPCRLITGRAPLPRRVRYSRFCTCSRIFSIRPFAASAAWLTSRSSAFEAIVLTSRFSSWIRKSSGRPTAPPLSRTRANCSRCARSHELVEGARHRIREDRPRGVRGGRVRLLQAHDARALEHPGERHLAVDADRRAELARQREVLRRQRLVHRNLLPGGARGGGELDGDLHVPALETRLHHTTCVHLEAGEGAWEPEGHVEVSVVEGPRFHSDCDRPGADLRPTESRHAPKGRDMPGAGGCHLAILG